MKLIIGGAYEGKVSFAAAKYHLSEEAFADCTAFNVEDFAGCAGIYNLHLWIRSQLAKGQSGEEIIAVLREIINQNPDMIIVMDEIGCGIVPMERNERIWRETVGSVGCLLAERAKSVERVVCGCGVVIK